MRLTTLLNQSDVKFRGKRIDELTESELRDALMQALNKVAQLEERLRRTETLLEAYYPNYEDSKLFMEGAK